MVSAGTGPGAGVPNCTATSVIRSRTKEDPKCIEGTGPLLGEPLGSVVQNEEETVVIKKEEEGTLKLDEKALLAKSKIKQMKSSAHKLFSVWNYASL